MMTRNRSQPAQIKARLLGQVQFLDGNDRELRLATRKARALLAFLIVEADRWHARDKLSGLLWGDRQQAQARHSLTQALGAIRRLEKIAGVSLLETGREHVRLRANAVDCDHSILCQALKANSSSVATAFTAPLMDGMDAVDPSFDEWLANQRNALSSSICSALRLTAAAAEKAGEHTDTISATQIWLSLEPSSEDAHRCLMRAYFAAGDRTAAIRQYQACERALRDDLGVTPSPETSALLDAIRSGTPSTTVAKQVGTEPDRGYAAANDPFPPSPRRVPRDTDLISLAVLPFENLSADPEQDFLCDGMAEDIINALSSLSGLRVIARQSTSRYRSQKMDPRRIADDLRVRYVLGGSIRRAGTRLRISAQLIDTVDETQAWADRYDREIEDIFDIQDEVMKEIVTALRLRLTSGQEAVVQARGTTNIEAWKYCVVARTSYDKLTATDHLEARVLAEKALQIDPNYAYAWAILSASYMREGRLGQTKRKEALRKAKEYNDKALSADKSLALAIGMNAVLLSTMAGPVEGTLASRRAIEMHPGDADLRAHAAYALSFAGQHEEALECVKIAIDLNPHAPSWYRMVVVRCCALLNRFEAAASLAEELLEQQPGLVAPLIFLAYSAHRMRQPVRAKSAVSRLRRYAPHMKQSMLPGFLSLPDAATVERIVCALGEAGLPD